MKIIIIGGAKTGYNLYKFSISNGLHPELYFFPGEYSEKKDIGRNFLVNWEGICHLRSIYKQIVVIVSSENAFTNLPEEDRAYLKAHYYLRDKLNLPSIAAQINTSFIKDEMLTDNVSFPLAVKPKESGQKNVPFKFRKINSRTELETLYPILNHCILQPYLDEKEHVQVAVAGYFDGLPTSLIAVEQKNHYPKGVSAYVIDKTGEYKWLLSNVGNYLNSIDYKGFIEFEFKHNVITNKLYLMDINPRPWGWFYYYLDGLDNFEEMVLYGASASVLPKKAWVNFPRLILANFRGQVSNPGILDIIKNDICYEPYF